MALSQMSLVLPLMSANDVQVVWNWGPHTWWMTSFKVALFVGFFVFLWFRGQDRVPATDLALKLRFGAIVHHKLKEPRQSRIKFLNLLLPEKKIRVLRETRFQFLNKILPRKTIDGEAKVYGPGLHIMWPGPDKFHKVDVRMRTLDLKPQPIRAKVGHKAADAVVRFRVVDLKPAVLDNLDLDKHLVTQGQTRQTWLADHGIPVWKIPKYVLEGLPEWQPSEDAEDPTEELPDNIKKGLIALGTECGTEVHDFFIDRLYDTEPTQNAKAFKDTGFNVKFIDGIPTIALSLVAA
jgi:hypothetical protein